MTSQNSQPVMLSAIQPTGRIHLGNYLGAIKNWVSLQDQYQCIFFAVDLHAITVRQDPKTLLENTYFAIATYIASGIDPKKATLFVQSQVPQHAELTWVLNCYAYMGELSRMTQFKDKSARSGKNIPAGLFTYPLLMAADILLYQTNLVPVGDDQKQHLELTRDLAQRMNNLYGKDLFTVPEIFLAKTASRVMDLQNPDSKMSSSTSGEAGAVFLNDTNKQIEKKVKRAVTDSGTEVSESDQPSGVKNLLQIQASCLGETYEQRLRNYVGKQYGYLKVETAEIISGHIGPIRDQTTELLKDRGELDRILEQGAQQARERAQKTLTSVYDRIGFKKST